MTAIHLLSVITARVLDLMGEVMADGRVTTRTDAQEDVRFPVKQPSLVIIEKAVSAAVQRPANRYVEALRWRRLLSLMERKSVPGCDPTKAATSA